MRRGRRPGSSVYARRCVGVWGGCVNTGVYVVNMWVFTVFSSILCNNRGGFRGFLGE
jgi:hypothetical protein